MPLYDYDCSACGRRFEIVHGVYAERPTVCPICGSGPIRKAISAAAVHYKGTGWAKKERRATASPGSSRTAEERSSADGGARNDDASPSGTPAAAATKASSKPGDTGSTGTGSGTTGEAGTTGATGTAD